MKVIAQRGPDGYARFNCPRPGCGKTLKIQNAGGGAVTCPRCQLRFQVLIEEPGPAAAALVPPQPPGPTAVPAPINHTHDAPPPASRPAVWLTPKLFVALLAAVMVTTLAVLGGGAFVVSTIIRKRPAPVVAEKTTEPESKSKDDEAARALASLPPVNLGPKDLVAALNQGLKLTGTLSSESVTEGVFPRTETFHRWTADVHLDNGSSVPLGFGPDLFLIEVGTTGASYEGYAVFRRKTPVVGPDSYGLDRNYEMEGMRINRGGGSVRYTFGTASGESFGAALPGQPWALKRDFPQFSWLLDDARADLCLVLPELRVKTEGGTERFRLLTYFARPAAGRSWSVREQRLIPIEPAGLKKQLADPGSNLVMKVLAANWLAESGPAEAPAALAAAAAPLREGQLLASSLVLLKQLKGPGLEAHALSLLGDEKLPNGVRGLSAEYLGAVKHAPALEPLVSAVGDKDPAVAGGAIQGLGSFGGPRAIETLSAVLRDKARGDHQRRAADSLARTKDPAAVQVLKDAVTAGNEPALQALAAAGLPETFDFFVGLADTVKELPRRTEVARGLKTSGGDKALPVLLRMLEQADPEAEKNQYGDGVATVLIELNKPEATPKLAELAGSGNVRAARVLAGSKNESVREPLVQLAGKASGPVLRAALDGLSNHWAAQSSDVFAPALTNADGEVVRAAIQGLQNGKHPKATELLVPVLEHADQGARQSAAWAVQNLPPGDQAPKLAAVLLRTGDPTVFSACSKLLIEAKWQDKAAVPKLAEKLRTAKDFDRYAIVRLLRHLSGNAMGPENDNEWYKDPEGWTKKWVEWAGKQ